jgi:2-oxoacid:acceptor oxidoreductase gamma subunit (pyruvate/2-ketoisovalerate family)
MRGIIFYGMGGQGLVTAAQILALAAGLHEEQYAQAIPAFTADRRGAPVHAYIRLSPEPILPHCFVYEPDCVVSFAWSATPWDEVRRTSHQPLICIANLPAEQTGRFLEQGLQGGCLDANRLTREILGSASPPNAAMLGAFSAVTGWIHLDAIIEAILTSWPGELGERNALAARRAYSDVSVVEGVR